MIEDMMTKAPAAGAMPVSAVAEAGVATISPSASLFEVAVALTGADVGALVVGEERPLGVISERDVVKAVAGGQPLDTTTALDVATTEIVWCDTEATVAEVAEEMCERYVRHVLVEEDGELVSVVSARDLLGVYASADVDLDG